MLGLPGPALNGPDPSLWRRLLGDGRQRLLLWWPTRQHELIFSSHTE